MFTQTPVGGRRARNRHQWPRIVSGDRPSVPLPSSGTSPSFSYGSPSINPPDIPTLHDTTVSLASALSTAQKNAQKKDYMNSNLNTPLKQSRVFKKEHSSNKSLFNRTYDDTEDNKISQLIAKDSEQELDNILNDKDLKDGLLDSGISRNNIEKNSSQIQDIKQSEKVTRYYLRENDNIDENLHMSLSYTTDNRVNPENPESRSYEEEELLYAQLNENDFDFLDETDYEYSISDDDKNIDDQEYTEDSDYERGSKILNFMYFCWFMVVSLSKQFLLYCFNSFLWPVRSVVMIFLVVINSVLKIAIRKIYTIFVIFLIILLVISPNLLRRNFIDMKWFSMSYFQPKYNFSFPQNTDELMQRLIFLEKTLKRYESITQDILQHKKEIFKAIKEVNVKRLEDSEETKLIKKEFGIFKNFFEKIKKEVSDMKQDDNKRNLQMNDIFNSLSFLQKNVSKYENRFVNHENSLTSFNKEILSVKEYVDYVYKKIANSQTISKNNISEEYIVERVIDVLESYIPSQLIKIDPKTKKIDINPEFLVVLQEIFPDRTEMNNTLKALILKDFKDINISLISWSNFLKNNEGDIKEFIMSQVNEKLKISEENGSIISKTYLVNILKQNLKKIQNDLEKNFTMIKAQISDQLKKLDYFYKNEIQFNHTEYLKNSKNIPNKAIETLIEAALHKYSSDILARPDFALYSSGARINPFLTSPTYLRRPTRLIPNLLSKIFWDIGSTWGHPPAMAIHYENNVGMCWAFPGSVGQISIRLSQVIFLTDVTIEHVDSNIAHDLSTAPRDVELWVEVNDSHMREQMIQQSLLSIKNSENTVPPSKFYVLAATMTYNIFSTYPIQTFPIPDAIKQLNIPIENVVFRIISNWGNNKFTCLYRVRVHGIDLLHEKIHSN
ncbi:hypothetical protein PORY_002585 [Pneumocystis oryctolagi]|uniref:Uncharacterized protein n=1 Tax=Pneumocystis oryctolagi TaxID=42067 RepID=A0ACB7CC55_9ASCO|nr:hypothetical protein PORY_002585 [Pneumocystis oryctolagi]